MKTLIHFNVGLRSWRHLEYTSTPWMALLFDNMEIAKGGRKSFWFDFCFTALQHILGHFGRGQLT